MKSILLIFAISLTPLILISGCFDSGIGMDDIEYKNRETLEFVDSGDGYLEEMESEIVFSLDIEEGQYLTHLNCWVRWWDEEPVNRVREYYNDGDQFSVRVSDGGNISKTGNGKNGPEGPGMAYTYFPGDLVDSQSVSRPVTLFVEVQLIYAGDHYAYQTNDESTKVEDTGNAYSWNLEYTITYETVN